MRQLISEVMTRDPITVPGSATLTEAARTMRDAGIGDVLVLQDDKLCGMVTDRDVVVRAVADGRDPNSTTVQDVCSHQLTTVSPDDDVSEAIRILREQNIRRLPVVEGGRAVGVVTLGDLAVEEDDGRTAGDALADISAAPPNN